MRSWKVQLPKCSICNEQRYAKTFENPERPDVCKFCDTHKKCGGTVRGERRRGCGRFLSKDMFPRGRQPDGKDDICKQCTLEIRRSYRAWATRSAERRKQFVEEKRRLVREGKIQRLLHKENY